MTDTSQRGMTVTLKWHQRFRAGPLLAGLAAVALLFGGATPAAAIVVGVNIDIHQDIQGPWPNDFHIEGRIESGEPLSAGGGGWSDPPVLIDHIDDIFPDFTSSITPDPNDPEENWYLVTADWSLPPGSLGIPYCTILHLGLFFDVTCHNIIIDLVGWWTLDGQPIGTGVNGGSIPVLGFNVQDAAPQLIQIRNDSGGATGAGIYGDVVAMDVVALPQDELLGLLGPNPFAELRDGGLQMGLPWVEVLQFGMPLDDFNFVPVPPDSFFDVMLDQSHPDLMPAMPVFIEPDGFLVSRQVLRFEGNDGMTEYRWFWEIHGAHPPPPPPPPPPPWLVAGINVDIHQDNVGQVANDFHIEGRIESSLPPALFQQINDRFPFWNVTITPDPADPTGLWYLVTADWWGAEVPFCEVLHLRLFFEVTCHNVVIDLVGWWTRDGQPLPGPGQNSGFAPMLGFEVNDGFGPGSDPFEGQVIHIQNGDGDGIPEPGELDMEVVQMDLVPLRLDEMMALLGDDPWGELRVGGLQEFLPWVEVTDETGVIISDINPEPIPPDSFFDVFFQGMPPPGGFSVVAPFTLDPGNFLIARQRVRFINNAGTMEQRWLFEIHGAHEPGELGDAPDSTNNFFVGMTAYAPGGGPPNTPARYPSVYLTGSPPFGPIHWWPDQAAYLGPMVSMETEADVGWDADGVNNIQPPLDLPDQDNFDDGVIVPLSLPHCQWTTFNFTVTTVNPVDPMYVNVWFDWTRDGDWDDVLTCPDGPADEWAVQNMMLVGLPPASSLPFTTPPFLPWHPTDPPTEIWMRITLSEQPWNPGASADRTGGDGPGNGHQFGETEDYYFLPEIEEPVPPPPPPWLVAGINVDIHQDNVGQVANDFHIEGRIESSLPPRLFQQINDRFPFWNVQITPDPTDPTGLWYLVTADWWGVDVPFCEVLHLGLFFEVTCHNVVIDLVGWWTRDGLPLPGTRQNDGFVPMLGFEVNDGFGPGSDPFEGQVIHIQNGDGDGIPEPGEIEMDVVQMDLVPLRLDELMTLLGDDPWGELRVGGLQELLPWVEVTDETGMIISDINPEWVPPDSFFDVYFQGMPPPGGFSVVAPFTLEPAGFLIARERIRFLNRAGTMEERWLFEIHGAHEPGELGDAPDSTNNFGVGMTAYAPGGGPPNTPASYPSVYLTGSPPFGPIHWWPDQAAYLGPMVSMETEADVGWDADGINNIDPPPDSPDQDNFDDGVIVPLSLPHCQWTTFNFTVATVNPVDPMWVNVWFDWTRDGDWDDLMSCPGGLADEWAVQNMMLAGLPPSSSLNFTTPPFLPWHGTDPPTEIWMRITLSEQPWDPTAGVTRTGGDGPSTGHQFGETEDYYFLPETVGPPPLEPKWLQPPHGPLEGFDAPSDLWWNEGGPVKWSQLPDYNITGQHCHDGPTNNAAIICANDWVCDGGRTTDFHWWGYQEPMGMNEQQWGFLISLHGHDPAACLPSDLGPFPLPMVWTVPLSQITVTDTGFVSIHGTPIYHYSWILPTPFDQVVGQQYWMDLSSISMQPTNPYIWKWCQSLPAPVLCPAAYKQLPTPGVWQSFDDIELAFEVTSDQPVQEVNKVVADDFVSDGRPIKALRWWGSHIDPIYAPDQGPAEPYVVDGWFISYHHNLDDVAVSTCPPDAWAGDWPTVLAVYFAPVDAVQLFPLGMVDCFGHEVYEYYIDLERCCLLCSHVDPRVPGAIPGQPDAFYEEAGLRYWLDVQAVVGVTWDPPACNYDDRILTGHLPSPNTADGHFWGWHTSPETSMNHSMYEEACTGHIVDFSTYPPDCWQYGGWQKQPWLCPPPPYPQPVQMAFELLAPQSVIDSAWSAKTHLGIGPFRLPLGNVMVDPLATNIESRQWGVTQLECEMSEAMNPASVQPLNVQVSCASHFYAPAIATSLLPGPNGPNTLVVVNLAPGMPDQDCCMVTLNGMTTTSGKAVQGATFAQILAGDVNFTERVNATDKNLVKGKILKPVNNVDFVYDVNASGIINATDKNLTKGWIGHIAPACP
ncbi:MAG: hypothetical protein GY778_06095 [bacterium]|nr:hypothetical protein [bacterium]